MIIPAVIVAPFLEEFAKAFPLFYRHGETVRSIFVLGFLTGLGFGIYELLTYVFVLGASILTRLPGIFFHASSTAITSYGIATKRTALFYSIAVLLHASSNFFAFAYFVIEPPLPTVPWNIGFGFAIALTYFLFFRLYKKTSEEFVE